MSKLWIHLRRVAIQCGWSASLGVECYYVNFDREHFRLVDGVLVKNFNGSLEWKKV